MKTLKIFFYSIISLFLLYVLAGFFLLPKILKSQAEKLIEENLYAKANIEKIEFNPLLLKLNIHNFFLDDFDGEKLVFFKELEIELGALKSIEQRHLRVENIFLDNLYLNIIQEKDAEINFANLLRKSDDNLENIEESKDISDNSKDDIAFLLAKIDLKNIDIDFTSKNENKDYNLNLRDLNYTIYDLGTFKNSLSSNNIKFRINKNTDVSIKGAINLEPFKAYGEIKIDDLRPKELLSYEKELFNFDINKDANINLVLDYQISNEDDFNLYLASKLLEINNLKLNQNKDEIANLEKLDIKKFDFDLNKQKINLKDISINNLIANMTLDEKGINFANLINSSDEKDEIIEEKKDEKPWIINLKNIDANANFSFDDKINKSKTKVNNIILKTQILNIIDSNIELKDANLTTKESSFKDSKNDLELSSLDTKIYLDNMNLLDNKINFSNIDLEKNGFNFIEKKSNIDIKNQNLKSKFKNLEITDDIKIENSSILLNRFTFLDKKSKLNIALDSVNSNLNSFNFDKNSNINLGNANIKIPIFSFKENINSLDISSKNIDINLSKILFDKNSNLSILNSKLNSSNFIFKDLKEKLNIILDKISTNLDTFSLDNKSNIKLKSANIKNPNLKFEDIQNKLSLDVKNTNIDLNSLAFDSNSNLNISKIVLSKPSLDMLDSKNSLKFLANDIDLDINSFKLKNSDIFLGEIKLLNPNMNFVNLDSNMKIDTKNIDLSLQKVISKTNFFKIEKSVLKDPYISIALAKSKNNQAENKSEVKKEISTKENEVKSDFRFNLGPVDIKNLTLDFEDNNLYPPFKTTISKLNGAISEVKSKNQSSQLEINGVVDKYASAKITGTVNPNDIKILTDINMKITNISMNSFTPYSAKFVGRNIDDGKLDLDLYYNILDSNLKAKNNIVIKKLKLGKNVESPDAVSLPLDLAITLLEDSSNTIDLNLPISGNIDDPEFSVASIVWKAFINLITKAITSPFSLISSLFSFAEDDIKSVNFELKEYEIGALQQEVLDKVAQVLETKDELAVSFTKAFIYEKEDIKFAKNRENSIKKYLEKEKNISAKQIIFSNETKSTSSNFSIKIIPIK